MNKAGQFVLVSAFLLSIPLIASALCFGFGWVMWHLDMPPDDYPWITCMGAIASLVGTYYITKHLHALIQRRM